MIRKFMLNYLLLVIFMLTFFVILTGCQEKKVLYKEGVYANSAEGYYSIIQVEVKVNPYQIEEIRIISHEDPQILADIVFEKLPPRIIKANSSKVDGISGATYTSKALLEAVDKALEMAKEGIN